MKKKRNIWTGIIAALITVTLVAGGCREAPPPQPQIPPDPFTTVWGLGEKQVVTFSGDSAGHVAGEPSEFMLKLDNRVADKPWQGEYCIMLLDRDGMVMEIAHEKFSIPAGLETQTPIMVQFRANLDGPYGLSILIPGRGQSINTIWIGEKRPPVSAGPWPAIETCPHYMTEEGSRQLAEEFVRNSSTFVFDGIEDTLILTNTVAFTSKVISPDAPASDGVKGWEFTFEFESRHAGYGDRTGQMLLQVITSHEAIVTVEQGEVTSAIMDGKWDMLAQNMTASNLKGTSWLLASYSGEMGTRKALEVNEVTLTFDSKENQLGGVAGCNHYGAPYEINGSRLTLTDYIIQTEMLCLEEGVMEQEANYLQALQAAENYEVEGDILTITGGGWTLEFEKQQ